MSDRTRGRKVRGSRIRSSRDEKAKQEHERELDGMSEAVDADTEMDITATDGTVFATEGEGFVETDGVREVMERIERWLSVGRPVHLIGPTGCGKTATAVEAARRRDRPVVFVNGDADLETSDLVGEYAGEERYSVRDKYVHNVHKSKDVVRDRWVDNPLTTAVREGATLVYNEFSRTKPVANNVLLSVFEEGVLELPGRRGEDRYVEVHPEFRAVLTSNSVEYAGVHEPQDALLDRLIGVHVDFYDADTETEIVATHVELPRPIVEAIVEVVREARATLDVTVGTRAAIMAAEGLAAMPPERRSPEMLTEVCTDVLSSKVPDRKAVVDLRDGLSTIVGEATFDVDWQAETTDRRT